METFCTHIHIKENEKKVLLWVFISFSFHLTIFLSSSSSIDCLLHDIDERSYILKIAIMLWSRDGESSEKVKLYLDFECA